MINYQPAYANRANPSESGKPARRDAGGVGAWNDMDGWGCLRHGTQCRQPGEVFMAPPTLHSVGRLIVIGNGPTTDDAMGRANTPMCGNLPEHDQK